MEASISDFLKVVLGAACALAGSLIHEHIISHKAKKQLLCNKLERAYSLCQAIYDGHKQQIENARNFLPANPGEFLGRRNHPGPEMSELKMLIRSYAPNIKTCLGIMDRGHNPLKQDFINLERNLPSTAFSHAQFDKWDEHLKELSKGSNEIKSGIVEKLKNLTS